MTDDALTESKFFHIVSVTMGVLLLGLLGYFAYTVQDTATLLKVMSEHVTSIDEKIDQGFGWQSKRLDDHEQRLRVLEQRK